MTTKTATRQCAHHWLIEGAVGPVSKGRCKFYGATRKFRNSWQGTASRPLPETKPHYGVYSRAAYDTSLMARCRISYHGDGGIN